MQLSLMCSPAASLGSCCPVSAPVCSVPVPVAVQGLARATAAACTRLVGVVASSVAQRGAAQRAQRALQGATREGC